MKKILLALVVCAGMCACTNDDVVVNNESVTLGEDGYVRFSLNLPTTGSTRAANDVYDDGLESEYAVYDATLLLFGGESESAATFYASYNLNTSWNLYETTTDNITTKSEVTQKISTPSFGKMYALVVLNNNGLLSEAGSNPTLISGVTTLTSLQKTIANLGGVGAMTKNGLFMCNAPLTSSPGGVYVPTGSVTTLAYIDDSKVFNSAAEAEAHPATEIYVERGMAKVTIVDKTPEETTEGIPAKIEGFVLDLTNNVSYLVRNTTGTEEWWDYTSGYSTNYRMSGSVAVDANLYRTYWATDPNYDEYPYTEATQGDDYSGARDYNGVMTSLAGTSPALTAVGSPLYCLENTFSVRHMNQDETTRAIIGAELYGGDDFYIWDNDKTTAYMDIKDIKALILTRLQAEGYMEEAEAAWVGPDPGVSDMYDYITIVFDNESSLVASDDLTFAYEVDDEVVAEWFVNPNDRTQPATEIPGALVVGSKEYAAIVADLNTHHQVAYYEGGISYYPVLIKHFGNDLTPWEDFGVTASSHNEESYPDGQYGNSTAEQNWLGRYGVLRNNWYEINVTGVNSIGSATVPSAYGIPDDPVEKWMSVEINILSWAKRTQDVTL